MTVTQVNRRTHRMSFRLKVLLGVSALIILNGIAMGIVSLRTQRTNVTGLASTLFREVSLHGVTQTRSHLLSAVPLIETLEHMADDGLALSDSDHLARQLADILATNTGVTWISYGDESGQFTGAYRTPDGQLRVNQSDIEDGVTMVEEHNVNADKSWTLHRKDNSSQYDPRKRPYYGRANQAGRVVWSPPYVFYDQAVPGITCANPVYDAKRKLRGVLTVDFDLNMLSKELPNLSVSPHSRFFLFTTDQTLLAYPGKRVVAKQGGGSEGRLLTLADVKDPVLEQYRANLKIEAVPHGCTDAFHQFGFTESGTRYLASATTFKMDDMEWVVGAIAPEGDFLAGVWQARQTEILVGLVALMIAVIFAVWLADRVSEPVLGLIGLMRRVGDGQLEERAEFGGSREFQELSIALNRMISDLRDRLRMRHSLSIANAVQQRLLPAKPPTIDGLDIAGYSSYCDETGGDYYDFLPGSVTAPQQHPTRFTAIVGDVAGHGVGAALVMAGARAVVRDRADSAALDELLARINRLLLGDLGGEKFMTMVLCDIDTRERTIRWSSAGHDAPFVYDPVSNEFRTLGRGGLPLGVDDAAHYEERNVDELPVGSVIVLATDGVWETHGPRGDMFGKDRLREIIRTNATRTATEIAGALVESLDRYRVGRDADDDVTLVVLKLTAPAHPSAPRPVPIIAHI